MYNIVKMFNEQGKYSRNHHQRGLNKLLGKIVYSSVYMTF